MSKRIMRRYIVKSYRRYNVLAIDFENEPSTGAFICAGIHGDTKQGFIDKYITDQAEFDRFIMAIPKSSCIIVTFNLSYDRTYFDRIADHSTALVTGTRVITMKLKNGLKLYDLTNHVDGSLADWIGYLDLTKHFGIRKARLKDYQARVMNDARATYCLGLFVQDFYNFECGIGLQTTVGSAALKIFARNHFTDYWEVDSNDISEFERSAYYGGRCELYQRGTIRTWGYDVNSMYLSIMAEALIPDPVSAVMYTRGIESQVEVEAKVKGMLGIWECTVTSPDGLWLPVLPVRLAGKLKFPGGTFTGVWTSIELRAALDAGYTIDKVYRYILYNKAKPYFASYAGFIWRKRQEYQAQGNRGMELLIKKLGNSLYGKFAQRNQDGYFGRLEDYTKPLPDGCYVFQYHDQVWVEEKGELLPAGFEFPCVAAFITSYARVKLYQAMAANQGGLIYCDTDSMKLTGPAAGIPVGKGLGEWGLEVDGKQVEYHRPKLYGLVHKGVPKRARKVRQTVTREVYVYTKPLRYREAIKAGKIPNTWVKVTKVLMYDDDKRAWTGDTSEPLRITEALDSPLLL